MRVKISHNFFQLSPEVAKTILQFCRILGLAIMLGFLGNSASPLLGQRTIAPAPLLGQARGPRYRTEAEVKPLRSYFKGAAERIGQVSLSPLLLRTNLAHYAGLYWEIDAQDLKQALSEFPILQGNFFQISWIPVGSTQVMCREVALPEKFTLKGVECLRFGLTDPQAPLSGRACLAWCLCLLSPQKEVLWQAKSLLW